VSPLAHAYLLACGAALGWAALDLSRRYLADRVRSLPLVAWTTLGSLPPLALWTGWVGAFEVGGGYALPALSSIALNVVANLAFFRSLQLAPLSETLPLLSLTPMFATVLGSFFLGERLTPKSAAGVALVVAGALLLSVRVATVEATGRRSVNVGAGARLMALVALCWSATIFLDKLALRAARPELHALVLNAGVAAAALAILAGRRELASLGAIRARVGWLVVAIAAGAAAIALQLWALVTLPIGTLETLKRGIGALSAVALGRLLFGESLTRSKLGAAALLVAGVSLLLL
jgi:drug/metabolite transporter (DMT)-like permease